MPRSRAPMTDAERAERDGAPDAEAAAPDVQRGDGVAALAEVELPVGDHVVEPAADEAERHRPDRQVADLAGTAAAGDPAPLADPDGDDDAEDDAQRVAADRQRPEVPHALAGAGDGLDEDLRQQGHVVIASREQVSIVGRNWPAEVSWSQKTGPGPSASMAITWVPWVTS